MNVSRLGVLGAGAAVGTGAAVALYLAIAPAAASAVSAGSATPLPLKTPMTSTSSLRPAAPRIVFADCVSPAVLEGQDCVTHIQVATAPVAVPAASVPARVKAAVRQPIATRPVVSALPAPIPGTGGPSPTPPAAAAPLVRTTAPASTQPGTGQDHAPETGDDHALEPGDAHAPEPGQAPSGATGDGQHPDGSLG